MITLKHHKFENIPTSSGTALPADTSTIPYLESHLNESEIILKNFNQYLLAASVFEEQSGNLIKSFKTYASTLLNENDRDVSFAKKGTLEFIKLLETFHGAVSSFIQDLKEKEIEPMKEDLTDLLVYPKETKKLMEKHQAQLEETRKAYRDTVASKRTTPAKIREAQEAQDSQKAKCTLAEQDYAAQTRAANFALCCQGPRAFATAYASVERMGRALLQYGAGARGAFREVTGQVEPDWSARIVVKNVASGCVGKIVETEKETLNQLSMVIDIYTRMTADIVALRLKPSDMTAIFGPLFEIFAVHSELVTDLEKTLHVDAQAPDQGAQTQTLTRVAKVLHDRIVPLNRCYIPFVRGHCECAALIASLRNSKAFQMIMQTIEQQQQAQAQASSSQAAAAAAGAASAGGAGGGGGSSGQAGQVQADLAQILAQAGKHVHSLKYTLQSIVAAIPRDSQEDKGGLVALENVIRALGDLTDKLDDIFIEMEHVRQLSAIKEQLPDLDEGIVEYPTRVFIYDSDAAVTSGGGQNPLIPDLVFASPPPEKTSRKLGRSKYVIPHHLFLFNDYFIIAERDEVTNSTDFSFPDADSSAPTVGGGGGSGNGVAGTPNVSGNTFHSILKLPILSFTVAPDSSSRNSIRITRGDSYLTISLLNEARVPVWLRILGTAQSEWDQTQFYGMSLQKVMSRPAEKGRLIPHLMEEFMAIVEQESWITTEGIYRLSTGKSILSKTRGLIDSGKSFDIKDVFTATNLLKLWLRELPDPLFTYKLYDEWVAASSVADVQQILRKLPVENRNLIQALALHLKHVAENSEKNMMGVKNLIIVFLPSILRSPNQMGLLESAKVSGASISTLIESYDEVFTGDLAPNVTEFTSTILLPKVREYEMIEDDSAEQENSSQSQAKAQLPKNEFAGAMAMKHARPRGESKFLSGHRSLIFPATSSGKDQEPVRQPSKEVIVQIPEKKAAESKHKKTSSLSLKGTSKSDKDADESKEGVTDDDKSAEEKHAHEGNDEGSAGNGNEEKEDSKKPVSAPKKKVLAKRPTRLPPRIPTTPESEEPAQKSDKPEAEAEKAEEPAQDETDKPEEQAQEPGSEEASVPVKTPRRKVLRKKPVEVEGEGEGAVKTPRRKVLRKKPVEVEREAENTEEQAQDETDKPEEQAQEPGSEEASVPVKTPRRKVLRKKPVEVEGEGEGEGEGVVKTPRRKVVRRKPAEVEGEGEEAVKTPRRKVVRRKPVEVEGEAEKAEEPAQEAEPEPEHEETSTPVNPVEPEPEAEEPAQEQEAEEAPVPARKPRKKVVHKKHAEVEGEGEGEGEEAPAPEREPKKKVVHKKHVEPEGEEPAQEQEAEPEPEPEKVEEPEPEPEPEEPEEAPIPPRKPRKVLPKKPIEPEQEPERVEEPAQEPEAEPEPEPEEAIPVKVHKKKVLPKRPVEPEAEAEEPEEEKPEKALPKKPAKLPPIPGSAPPPAVRTKRVLHRTPSALPPRPPPKLGMEGEERGEGEGNAHQLPLKPRAKSQFMNLRARCPAPPPKSNEDEDEDEN